MPLETLESKTREAPRAFLPEESSISKTNVCDKEKRHFQSDPAVELVLNDFFFFCFGQFTIRVDFDLLLGFS